VTETWYRVSTFCYPQIETAAVERSTRSSVWIMGRRQARESTFHMFYPTLGEAIDRGRKMLRDALAEKKRHYEYAQGQQAEFEHLIATGKVAGER
jgi:hypothetical protein